MATSNSQTVRYNDSELQEFKVIIENKIERAEAELKYIEEQFVFSLIL